MLTQFVEAIAGDEDALAEVLEAYRATKVICEHLARNTSKLKSNGLIKIFLFFFSCRLHCAHSQREDLLLLLMMRERKMMR